MNFNLINTYEESFCQIQTTNKSFNNIWFKRDPCTESKKLEAEIKYYVGTVGWFILCTVLSNSKIDGRHKIFSLSMSKALEKSIFLENWCMFRVAPKALKFQKISRTCNVDFWLFGPGPTIFKIHNRTDILNSKEFNGVFIGRIKSSN